MGFSPIFRYSCQHSHFPDLHDRFHDRFDALGTLSYRALDPQIQCTRGFGGVLEPR